jgi:tetratricopeptide (TPR) repeat protein
MLSALLGDDPELEPIKRLIAEKTEGIPFFVQEMVQTLFEQDVLVRNGGVKLTRPLPETKVPATVQALIASRIDRLPPREKELLQALAVIGRESTLPLISRVAGRPEAELESMLGELHRSEFIYEQPTFSDSEFSFKYALTQEVAYNSVLIQRRRQFHQRTAEAIEALFGDTINNHLDDLAHHYRRAGNADKASDYSGRAGEQALARSAYTEAQDHLTAALRLLNQLPEDGDRDPRGLHLRLVLGGVLTATRGFDSDERRQSYERARQLCHPLGETSELFWVLWHLCQTDIARDGLAQAFKLAEDSFRLAENTRDPEQLLAAHSNMGESLWRLGRPAEASAHYHAALKLYDARRHRPLVAIYGADLWVFNSLGLSLCEFIVGLVDQAATRAEATIAHAREVGHAYSLAFALVAAAGVASWRGEWPLQQELGREAAAVAVEHGFSEMEFWAKGVKSDALFAQGRVDEGINEMAEAARESPLSGASSNAWFTSESLIDA